VIGSFELRAENAGQIPAMLAQGVRRMDQLYIQALNAGMLRPNPTLITPAAFLPPPPPRPPVTTDEGTGGLGEVPAVEFPITSTPSGPTTLPPAQPTPTPAPTPTPTPPPATPPVRG